MVGILLNDEESSDNGDDISVSEDNDLWSEELNGLGRP